MKIAQPSIDQCFHVWAQQNQLKGYSGNVSFEGSALYSYSTPIARIVEATGAGSPVKVALLSVEKFSVSTSSHQIAASAAVSHYPRFHVLHLAECREGLQRKKPPRDWHAGNMADYIRRYGDMTLKLARAKNNAEFHASELSELRKEAERYGMLFNTPFDAALFPAPDAALLADMIAKANKASAEKAAATKEENAKLRLQIDEIVTRYLAGETQNVFPWGWERLVSPGLYEQVKVKVLEQWRNSPADTQRGDFIIGLGSLPVALRIKNADSDADVVQTSRGAEFPLADAVRAYRLLNGYKKKGLGAALGGDFAVSVGSFRIDAIDPEGNVKAGCHVVAWPEIERLANQLGLAA